MDQRRELARLAAAPGANLSALARAFGVDRKTVYKWRDRALEASAFAERARTPLRQPTRTDPAIEAAVLALRARHPSWGGRKLRAALARAGTAAPAASTITEILRRHGVEIGAFGGGAAPFQRFEHDAPNDLWQMDFKGHVAMRDGARLHPLTVLDDHSRFCIVLGACADERTDTVKTHLIKAFRAYGRPRTILCDNGAPWGDGPGSPFTPLGVWLIEHDVRVAHARPYHPQTMGKDERFHRTLKLELLRRQSFAAVPQAARAFVQWRELYNTARPHEALNNAVPAERYNPSRRAFRAHVSPFDYPHAALIRRVQQGGRLWLQGRWMRVPKAFRGKDVALLETETDGLYAVRFRHVEIARLDIKTGKRHPPKLSTMSPNDCG